MKGDFIMKKSLVLVLAFAMIISCFCISVSAAWDGSSKTDFTGTGTEADPYVIDIPEKLAKLAEMPAIPRLRMPRLLPMPQRLP